MEAITSFPLYYITTVGLTLEREQAKQNQHNQEIENNREQHEHKNNMLKISRESREIGQLQKQMMDMEKQIHRLNK